MKPEDVGGDLMAAFQDAYSWGGLRAGIAAVASLVAAPAWRTMDSAPRDGTEVLTYDGFGYRIVTWQPDIDGWWNEEGMECFPTHWQPLPEPPLTITDDTQGPLPIMERGK